MITNLDNEEEKLIALFRSHKVFQGIEFISQKDFLQILLQRRFLSLEFTKVYDMAIDGLTDIEATKIARKILREEYPDINGNTPSHREELVYDLISLGATQSEISGSRQTVTTTRTIEEIESLISVAGSELCDIKLLTVLRFWGEILISVEYGEFWKRMSKQLSISGDNQSRFYYPHYCHDARESMEKASLLSSTHSGRLGSRLREMLETEKNGEYFLEMEREILDIKTKFYDQFTELPSYKLLLVN
ncbi:MULTISPECIES: hypothetical protein [Nostocales]|jgi:hypothetical protein|uniref:hypothetical protein n=1 Tax=Nostocales TaxID=1161 RepID=UPI00197AB65B|nr:MULTISPECIES: hypothetical protein [Nostocales]